jgi:mono/diheme cytochrome c family protein
MNVLSAIRRLYSIRAWRERLTVFLLLTLLLLGAIDSIAAADETIDYLAQIKPLLAEHCYACHGGLKQMGGLRLDTAELALKGGDSGPVIEPGNADSSVLIQRVTASDENERMPAEGPPLEPQQIAVLKAWIAQRALAPADERPERDAREHWAFRPVARPPVPEVANPSWVRNPIDAFIAHQLERFGLTPSAEAPREVLVRRVYLDLIGLPPTAQDLAELDGTSGDGWYESLVDRLLNDPRHGERWARHWMDIWRYSDWWGLGSELRFSQYHIWHWRDWIVESLNSNTPFDALIRLMLAGDELHPNDLDKLRATGYLARNWGLFNRDFWMEDVIEHVSKGFLGLTMNCAKCHDHKYDPIEQVDFYRMRAFFEPYHVRMDMVPGETDLTRDGIPRPFDGRLDAPTYRYERGQESQPDKSVVIAPGVPEMLAFDEIRIQPISLPHDAWQPERRPWVLDSYLSAAKQSVSSAEARVAKVKENHDAAEKQLAEARKSARAEKAVLESAEAATVDAAAELQTAEFGLDAAGSELHSIECRAAATRAGWALANGNASDAKLVDEHRCAVSNAVRAERQAALAKARYTVTEIELRLRRSSEEAKTAIDAELATARESLTKAEQTVASEVAADAQFTAFVGAKWTPTRFMNSTANDPTVDFPAQSTGRRTALAKWITDHRNPLTARVAVNHIWARHMGTPLVSTVFDFGRNGAPPTHPELLDWLAAEFIAPSSGSPGWDMKHLHRLIVISSAYRMSSSVAGNESNLAKDPENNQLWRRTPVRLESEVVRDSILSLAETLDGTRGGPPVMPAAQVESTRRSLYFFHSNNERNAFLLTFDGASVKECYRREQSVLPQQALALSNSRLVHDAAGRIAERLSQPTDSEQRPSDQEFVRNAFYALLGIRASDDEVRASMQAMDAWRKVAERPDRAAVDPARQHLVWALFNHGDFVTVR